MPRRSTRPAPRASKARVLRLKELEKRKAGAEWLKGWEALYDWEEDQSGALIFLQNVHPVAEVRAEAEKCEQRWSDFQAALGMDAPRLPGRPPVRQPRSRIRSTSAPRNWRSKASRIPALR